MHFINDRSKSIANFSKLIVGHKSAMNITEKVYTHIDIKLLIDAINSMYYPEHLKLSD